MGILTAKGDVFQSLSPGKPIEDSIRDQAANLLKAVKQQLLATKDIKMRLPRGSPDLRSQA
jgi:hypothetical protein